MKKLSLALILIAISTFAFSQDKTKEQKKKERTDRINKLMKQEEEGAMVFNKQSAFGLKLNTDGYGLFYEHGKYKTTKITNLWWAEIGERKDPHEEKKTPTDASGLFQVGNPLIYGKINNLFFVNLGIGQQRLIGNKDVKNGVAVSAIYGAGFSAGLVKPYMLKVVDSTGSSTKNIQYSEANDVYYRLLSDVNGGAGFGKGFKDLTFNPGITARAAVRFDYGRFNELLSAIEAGLNATYYTKDVEMMLDYKPKKFFFNAYVAIVFGKRK